MKRTSALLACLVVACATLTAVASGDPSKPKRDRGVTLRDLRGVNFVSACRFSHRAPDDPIVSPGQPGASHDHSFVGNRSTNAFSTLDSLLGAGTTCRRAGETAAYWMPTLLVAGKPVAPVGATIYYRRHSLDRVEPFPQGLKMVAGSAHAMSPQGRRITFWNCGAMAGIPPSSTVPTCPAGRGSYLRLHVSFPDCWDGRSLDSADHASHMAYSMRGRCAASHPVAVPAIALIYRYPVAGGPDVELSSGGQYSGHADFFNAWEKGALNHLVNSCLNALHHCGHGS